MKRFIPILLLFSFFLSSGLLYAKPTDESDEESKHCLCAVRYDLYQYACRLFNVNDAKILETLDTISLKSFNKSIEKKLKSKEVKKDSNYRKALLHLQKLVNCSQPIEGKDYIADYNSLTNNIISVFSYAKSLAGADISSLEREEAEYLKKAAYAIVESQAHTAAVLDTLTISVFDKAFPQGYFSERNKIVRVENIRNKKEDLKKAFKSLLEVSLIVLLALGVGYYFGNRRNKKLIEHKGTGEEDIINVAQEKKAKIIHEDKPVKKDIVIRNSEDRGFIIENDKTCVVGASIIGKNHIAMNFPCQDACAYEVLGSGWGIAVSSDGAGSAEHSEIGSKIVVKRAIENFKKLISSKEWIKNNYCPTEAEWSQLSYIAIKAVRDDLISFAQAKDLEVSSLNATLIVIVHTPCALLSSHVGDGRAGYRDKNGEWKALITPHKGDEANQTIFVPSGFWDVPNYVMSGVFVPESRVIKEEFTAFTLMSDGCESSSWLYNQFDEKMGRYFDPNQPFSKFFDPIIDNLHQMHISDVRLETRLNNWCRFLESGGKFANEPDDKTMIIGICYDSIS